MRGLTNSCGEPELHEYLLDQFHNRRRAQTLNP